jgi:osmotically inducible lipoprotein OsmB
MKKLALIAATALFAAGCSTWDGLSGQEKGTVIGAGAGGVIGSQVVDGPLGVIGGAAVGGVIGNQIGKRQDEKP